MITIRDDNTFVPTKLWVNDIQDLEPGARTQLANLANHPGIFHHVAVMPDVHVGKGATVGSVIATRGTIIPAAVGVDIGCGMMAVLTPFEASQLPDNLSALRTAIEWSVPVGFHAHKNTDRNLAHDWSGFSLERFEGVLPYECVKDLKGKAMKQLGTLGGGNHFIEVCLDEHQHVWVMLHSGSRNIGKELAEHHIEEAKGEMKAYFITLPDPDLAYFVEHTEAFDDYLQSLHWAQAYAMHNRQVMMRLVLEAMAQVLFNNRHAPIERIVEVNCHHNYTEKEHHYGHNVWVTRKGAVRARLGDFGIIPGSMGTRSYIVEGLGNPESFCSCSHGAGRRMSRTKARATFSVADLAEQTAGVECRKDPAIVDEIPGAYKDIDQVMANQADLVRVYATLKQILCVKG